MESRLCRKWRENEKREREGDPKARQTDTVNSESRTYRMRERGKNPRQNIDEDK